jgi:hypothetical protein
VGNEVRTITKLFKNTEIRIAYKTKNTIQHHLQLKENNDPDKYDHSGVYEISCRNCKLKSLGQIRTGKQTRGQDKPTNVFRICRGRASRECSEVTDMKGKVSLWPIFISSSEPD